MLFRDPRLDTKAAHSDALSSRISYFTLDARTGITYVKSIQRLLPEGSTLDVQSALFDSAYVIRCVLLSERHLIAFSISQHDAATGYNILEHLYVQPAFRRKKLGASLVYNVIREVRDWPTRVDTAGSDDQEGANAFLTELGFHRVDQTDWRLPALGSGGRPKGRATSRKNLQNPQAVD